MRSRQDAAAQAPSARRISWELVHVARSDLESLEERANIVCAAQVAGLIALFIGAYDFEPGLPRALALTALAILLGSLVVSAFAVRPWHSPPLLERVLTGGAFVEEESAGPVEAEIVVSVYGCVRREVDRLAKLLWLTTSLAIAAALIAGVSYVIDTHR